MTSTNLVLTVANTLMLALLLANVSITWSTGFNSFYGESKKVQTDKMRSIAISEVLLEEDRDPLLENSFQDGRAVIPIETLRGRSSATDGHCYVPGVPRLDGTNFSMYVSPVSDDIDARDECLSPPESSTYSVSTPVLVETPSEAGPKTRQTVPAIITVYAVA